MYSLIISPEVQKQFKKIKLAYRKEAISEAFLEIKEDPYVGKALEDDLKGSFTYKLGVYRIIYKINEEDKTVLITGAGHRSTVYD